MCFRIKASLSLGEIKIKSNIGDGEKVIVNLLIVVIHKVPAISRIRV